ncbi:polyketide cyclase [Taibaiella lutea]|uniref:Polyketide cyclase n=1 Tax=Taibaiella lutea TaxID=2608001 RepID=A0A5M6CPD5_9BACT|nr:SRPBCC family protein [Taibaiella lutea]KAA5537101.1 polyketide cyclase [Taibaiella lutea]
MEKTVLTINAAINAPVKKVWEMFNDPQHVTKWNNPSPDWHTPKAENDLREGGNFIYRMEAKDGSFGFDFGGTYDEVKPHERIAYTMGDGRKVHATFREEGGVTHIIENFEAETQNTLEVQQTGWQGILDNFKSYVESN